MKWVFLFLIIFGFFPVIAHGQENTNNLDISWDNFSLTFDSPENYFNEVSRNLAAGSTIYDLGIYIGGMAAYAIFVWHFYRFIARREIIPIDYDKYNSKGRFSPVRIIAYIISHILLFPLIIFVWFFIYSMFMFILAKDMPTGVVLLIAISVIGAIRVTSYYKEDLSKDVGKLLPFALLGVFLTSSAFYTGTSNFFSLEDLETKFQEFPQFLSSVIEFVLIIVIIEAVLRTLFIIKRKLFPAAEEKLEEQIEDQIDEKIKTRVEIFEKKQKDLERKIEKETDEIEKKLKNENNPKE